MDPHQVLGVSASATDAEVRSAYKRAVKKYHPDINHGRHTDRAEAERMIREVNAAYERVCEWRRSNAGAYQSQSGSKGGGGGGHSNSRQQRAGGFYGRGGFYTHTARGGAENADFASQYARYEQETRNHYRRYQAAAGGAHGYHAHTYTMHARNLRHGLALFFICISPFVYFDWKSRQMYTYSEKYGQHAASLAKEQAHAQRTQPRFEAKPKYGKKD